MQTEHVCEDVRGFSLPPGTPARDIADLQARLGGNLNVINAHGAPFIYADDEKTRAALNAIGHTAGLREQVRDLRRI